MSFITVCKVNILLYVIFTKDELSVESKISCANCYRLYMIHFTKTPNSTAPPEKIPPTPGNHPPTPPATPHPREPSPSNLSHGITVV